MFGIFEILHKSSWSLHKRFDNVPPEMTGQLFAFEEEVREAVEEARAFMKGGGVKANLIEEALDVMVTISGMFLSAGIKLDDLKASAEKVAEKNDKKTASTHVKDEFTKKIRRKTVQEVLVELNGKSYTDGYLLIPTPTWVSNAVVKPMSDGKYSLARQIPTGLKNDKYVSCQCVFSKGLVSTNIEIVHIDTAVIHDREKLQSLLLKNGLVKKGTDAK